MGTLSQEAPGSSPAESKDGLGWVAIRMQLSAKYKYSGNEARRVQVVAAKVGIHRADMDPRFRWGDELDAGFSDPLARQLVLAVCFHRHSRFVRKNSCSGDLQVGRTWRPGLEVAATRQFCLVVCFHRHSRFARKNSRSAGTVWRENDRLWASGGRSRMSFMRGIHNRPRARTPSPGPPRLKRAPAAAHPPRFLGSDEPHRGPEIGLPQGGEGLGQGAARRSLQDGHRLIFCRSSVILGVRTA